MTIERTDNEVIIRLSASVDAESLQDMVNYARYKELTANIKVDQQEVNKLTDDIDSSWWAENKHRFIK